MANTTKIVLGGTEFEVAPPPFGLLKKIIVAFNKASAAGLGSVDGIAAISTVLALMVGKTDEELDAMPITMNEIITATNAVPAILGLVQKESAPGEAPVA